jgi:hypothetical protein
LFQDEFILPEFMIQLSFPSPAVVVETEQLENINLMASNNDPSYPFYFGKKSKETVINPFQSLSLNDKLRSTAGLPNSSQTTISNQLSQNYFDYIENLQNSQWKEEGSSLEEVNPYLSSSVSPTSSSQKNIIIKQNALLSIENSVKECQLANHLLLQQSSKRLVQLLNQFHQKNDMKSSNESNSDKNSIDEDNPQNNNNKNKNNQKHNQKQQNEENYFS